MGRHTPTLHSGSGSGSNFPALTSTRSSKAERNGRKLPGRVVLIVLVALVVIFLDIESSSLTRYGEALDKANHIDSNQVAVGSASYAEQNLGRLQRQQLEHQWLQYVQRANHSEERHVSIPIEPPQMIVVEPQPILSAREEGVYTNDHKTESMQNVAVVSLGDKLLDDGNLINTSIEEIVSIDIDDTNFNNTDAWTSNVNTTLVSLPPPPVVEHLIVVEHSTACLPYNTNSLSWKNGVRFTNDDSNMTDEHIFRQILFANFLDPLEYTFLSSQTPCHAESLFGNPSWEIQWDATNNELIEEWELRLLYMAIHHHQQSPATREAMERQSCFGTLDTQQEQGEKEKYNISKMDYECPTAKFLVSNMTFTMDWKKSIQIDAVNTMLMGIATNRVVMFIPEDATLSSLTQPSLPTNCRRRRPHDMQCYFLPITPCTILLDDWKNATTFSMKHVQDLQQEQQQRRRNNMPEDDDLQPRILLMNSSLHPWKDTRIFHTMVQTRLHAIAVKLIDTIRHSASPEQILVLETAAARIIQWENHTTTSNRDDKNTSSNNNTNGNTNDLEFMHHDQSSRSAHAALLYLIRHNVQYQQRTNDIVKQRIPLDLDPNQATFIGVSLVDYPLQNCAFHIDNGNGNVVEGHVTNKEHGPCVEWNSIMEWIHQISTSPRYNISAIPESDNRTIDIILTIENDDFKDNNNNNESDAQQHKFVQAQQRWYNHRNVSASSAPFRWIVLDRSMTTTTASPTQKAPPYNLGGAEHDNTVNEDSVLMSMVSIKLQLESTILLIFAKDGCSGNQHMLMDLYQHGCGTRRRRRFQSTDILPTTMNSTTTTFPLHSTNTSAHEWYHQSPIILY